MPHKEHLELIELHPTFGAEVRGIDFSQPIPEDIFSEIQAAITKVILSVHFTRTALLTKLPVRRPRFPQNQPQRR